MTNKSVRTDLKILVIGASGTGKTSFVQRWCKGDFKEEYKPTVVSEFGFKLYQNKDFLYRVQLWDIGGQDKSPSMARIFSRDSHGCIVLSDINNESSIEDVLNWKKVVENESNFIDGGKLPFVLVMNKIDLMKDVNELSMFEKKAENMCNENNFNKYFLTSVKENENINETMDYLLNYIIERLEKCEKEGHQVFRDEQDLRNTLRIRNNKGSIRREKNGCC